MSIASTRVPRSTRMSVVTVVSVALVFGGLTSSANAANEPAKTSSKASDVPTDTDGDGILDRPDKASAMSSAVVQKKRYEDLSARTESTATYANPDGSWSVEAYSAPVRAQDADGKWVPVDSDVAAEGGAYVPKASPYDVSFGDGGGKTIAAIAGVDGKPIGLGWPDKLPAPTAAGDTLTYPNVDGTSDLVVQSKPNGFSYSVVLDKAPAPGDAPVEIRYPLSLGDATATLGSDGSVAIKRGKTKIGSMTAPIMFDSSTGSKDAADDEASSDPAPAPSADELADPADSDVASGGKDDPKPIATSLEGEGDSTTLVLRPDMAFLTDPSTVYPLTIDPTFVVASAADTYIQSSGNTNSQLGSPELRVGSNDGGTTVARSLVYFDLSGSPTLVPAQITAATVTTSNFETGACTGSALTMSRITSGWDGAAVTWATQPSVTSTGATQSSASYGATGCAAEGTISFDATQIVKDWAAGAAAVGVQIKANDETVASGFRKLRSAYNGDSSKVAKLSYTYNSTPSVPTNPQVSPSVADGSVKLTANTKPTFSAAVSDPDGGNVTGEFKLVDSSGTTVDSWTSGSVLSGSRVSRQPATALAQGNYTASWRTSDGTTSSAWSAGQSITVDTTAPATPTVSCTNLTNGTWYDTRPASSTTCTMTTSSDTATASVFSNAPGGKSYFYGAPSSNSVTVTIPVATDSAADISFVAYDKTSNNSVLKYQFGTGGGSLSAPLDGSSSIDNFNVSAASNKDATSAQLQWRKTGSTSWTAATQVNVGNYPWLGTPSNSGLAASAATGLTWNASAESGVTKPSVLDVRMCFNYSGTPSQRCTPVSKVNVVPHAFGGSYPTTSVGPASVSLLSGEYQVDSTDVTVPGANSDVSLTRTYQSLGDAVSPAQGVFGPGWVANLQGPDAGFAAAQVIDNTAVDGSITLLDTDGSASTYVASTGGASAQKTDIYKGIGEASTFNEKLEITGTTSKTLTLTEDDGTITTWVFTSPNVWKVQSVVDPSATPATTYGYNGSYVTEIYAGIPGVVCNASQQAEGCRWLKLTYSTINSGQRLTKVEMKTAGSSAVTTQTVQEYGYDSTGKLTSTWDPREDPTSGTHLTTQYTYTTVNSRSFLRTITPPGQTPWQFNLNSNGTLDTVTRAQTAAVGGTDATWRVVYNVATSGTNLPTVTPEEVAKWGQPQAPDTAAAVYGPDAPDTSDPRYADITYFTKDGRTTNTATYGAGAWQIQSTGYDPNGQVNWSLDNTSRKTGFSYGWDGPTISAMLATRTEYSADGTRVERTLGPLRNTLLDDGTAAYVRPVTENDYDDEVASSLKPGAPTTTPGANDPKRNMLITTRVGSQLSTGGSLLDVDTTQYRYDKVVSTDGDGWTLKMPTRVSTSLGSGTSTTLTRFDTEGKTIETRTPQGVAAVNGAGSDGRSTMTTYYTAGANAADSACGNKPAWVGAVCKTGPAGSSSTAPTTATTNFDYLLDPTTVTEASGSMTRTTTNVYDSAGRMTSGSTTLSGATSGDLPVTASSYGFSTTTGLPTTTTTGSVTVTTGYDAWGRITSQTDGNGNTGTTTYDTAGRVKTVDDGKGVYTYTFDGTDSLGKLERRGLVTKLDVGLSSGPDEFAVAYDDNGSQAQLVYPNGVKADSTYDTVGNRTTLTYSRDGTAITSFVNYSDIKGRTRAEQSLMSATSYTYDGRDRLTRVADTVWGQCTTRAYTFSLDSDREKLETYAPGSGGACTTTSPTTKSSTFDGDDRITNTGYTYDAFGRTRTLPASDTDQPSGGTATLNYYANDMVAKISQQVPSSGNLLEKSYGLDAMQRLSMMSSKTAGVELRKTVNHYSDTSDSPAWIETQTRPNASTAWATTWTRNVEGPDGDLGLIQSSDGTSRIQLTDMRGSIVATLPNTTAAYAGLENYSESDEYGNTKAGGYPLNQTYTWLGDKRRSTDTVAGLTLMGVRLYESTSGRFLSRDGIAGGNDNSYAYPTDPVNKTDLSGLFQEGGTGVSRQQGIDHTKNTNYLPKERHQAGKRMAAKNQKTREAEKRREDSHTAGYSCQRRCGDPYAASKGYRHETFKHFKNRMGNCGLLALDAGLTAYGVGGVVKATGRKAAAIAGVGVVRGLPDPISESKTCFAPNPVSAP